MTLPETLPRAAPDDEGPFLIEVPVSARLLGRWWRANAAGYTSDLTQAGRYTHDDVHSLGAFEAFYAVSVPSRPYFNLTTRLGRVQAAWWLRDLPAPQDVMSTEERRAYGCALIGDDACDVGSLDALVKRYGVKS